MDEPLSIFGKGRLSYMFIELICSQTMVNVIDNSGAAVAECVKVLKMKRHAKIGM